MHSFKTGMHAEINRTFTQADLHSFANLSLDQNPIHTDPDYACETPFGSTIVHGMLVGSLFSALLGAHLPGAGTVYLGQNLKFLKPVFPDQEITARVTITHIREDKPIATLSTEAINPKGEIVLSGEAVVKLPGESQ